MEKARGRGLSLRNSEVDLDTLAADVARSRAPGAIQRGVSLTFDVAGNSGPVQGDPVMISEALDNLIDNALRYGCNGGGKVAVRVEHDPDRARLSVRATKRGSSSRNRRAAWWIGTSRQVDTGSPL